MGKLIMGYWDCPFCGSKGVRGDIVNCPSCGKGMQKLEQVPFTLKCYYCGTEFLCNPFMKYDGLDPEEIEYRPDKATSEELNEHSKPENYEQRQVQSEEDEIANAKEILDREYQPYDVSKDLNFEDENI